jgi:hypothetical protein
MLVPVKLLSDITLLCRVTGVLILLQLPTRANFALTPNTKLLRQQLHRQSPGLGHERAGMPYGSCFLFPSVIALDSADLHFTAAAASVTRLQGLGECVSL